MEGRIECVQLRERITSEAQAAECIKNGMTVAVGGYTSSGYPKVIVNELVRRKKSGEDLKINLISGANVGPIDTALGNENMVKRRAPLIESKVMAKLINNGEVSYIEQQMCKMPRLIKEEAFGKIDVAIIEALRITKDGYIVPTSSIGMVPYLLEMAETIIVEINIAQPMVLDGMHDVYLPSFPPNRKPIPLTYTNEKIGEPFIKVDSDKIRYIVKSEILDVTSKPSESQEETRQIARNLFDFLELEVKKMPGGRLTPIQTGFGNLASEIVRAFDKSNFKDIEFFCGVLQEANIELIANGKVKAASTGSIQMTPKAIELTKKHSDIIRETVVIRNTDVTNQAETISRLGLITLNSAIEIDMYGNVNSSHISGTKVVNGIGGGANFAQNAGLSIMLLESERKGGDISSIVPMVAHQDISEHDIDVIITENGVADLRGKDDIERAKCVIENCAGPNYKEVLSEYLERAINEVGGHHPQILAEALSWHIRLKDTGSMRIK